MLDFRIISRIDIKGPNVIKGFQMEGLRIIGNPKTISQEYYNQGIDEIIFNDVVASLYGREQILELIEFATQDFFIPLTIVGGIRSINNAKELFKRGADKVAVNTAALKNPKLLKEISDSYGSQALVLSVEAKRNSKGGWDTYGDSGRTNYGKSVLNWIQESISLGVGEVLLTSVDRDGTKSGFDIELIQHISSDITVPLILSGGIATQHHVTQIARIPKVDGIAIGCAFHEKVLTVEGVKNYVQSTGRQIRE
jgi:cyclase